MKRLVIAAGVVVLGTGGALAACPTGGLGTDQLQTLNPGFLVEASGPTSMDCNIAGELPASALPPIGETRHVVYKVDMRPDFFLVDDVTVIRLTYTVEGVTKTFEFREGDPEFPLLFLSEKYAADGLDGFNGDFLLEYDGTDPDGAGFLDEIFLTMGWTTTSEQQASFDQIGLQQVGLVTHLDGMTGLLTGGNRPLEGDDEIGLIGGYGSYMAGVTGRLNLVDGFSLLGGASIVDFGMPGASASGVNGALALRYVEPTGGSMRFFGEAGAQIGALNLNLSRSYYDSLTFSDDYDATSTGSGLLGAVYIRGGVVIAPMPDNEVVVSASLKQSALGIGNFSEADPEADPNFFVADLTGSTTSITTVKAGVDWTTQLASDVDLTASGHVGAAFGSGVKGDVFGVGTVTGTAQSTIFAQYGLRLGWTLSPGSKLDGFVQGTTGTGIGTHAQVGAAYRMSF